MDNEARNAGADRPEGEAVRNARQRIALLAETVGARHPDYATGLNQLALLLIREGGPDTAEPLLREALDVRRESLGDSHPDYATNLDSLGKLLWDRGELDDAEPLLRRAAEIRVNTLGAAHPKTTESQSSLEQLLQARRAAQAAAPQPDPEPDERLLGPPLIQSTPPAAPEVIPFIPTAWAAPYSAPLEAPGPSSPTWEDEPDSRDEWLPEPVASEEAPDSATAAYEYSAPSKEVNPPASPGIDGGPDEAEGEKASVNDLDEPQLSEIGVRLRAARDEFAELGRALEGSAERLRTFGALPSEEEVARARGCLRTFHDLAATIAASASGLEIDAPTADLDALDALLGRVEREAEARRSGAAARARALPTLEGVLRLACPTDRDFAPLARCREQVQAIIARMTTEPIAAWAEEAEAVAEGAHPAFALLALVRSGDDAADEQWADWYDRVEAAYGTALAVAAARSRIVATAP